MTDAQQAAIREAESDIARIVGNLVHQANVKILKVTVLVQPSTFEAFIEAR